MVKTLVRYADNTGMETKQCTKCRANKPVTDFGKNPQGRGGLRAACKPCVATWHGQHWTEKRFTETARRYGITPEEYLDLLQKSNGLCGICENPEAATRNGKPKLLSVDHDHTTGEIRGLLCTKCNTALGLFSDNPTSLLRAVEYLRGGDARH